MTLEDAARAPIAPALALPSAAMRRTFAVLTFLALAACGSGAPDECATYAKRDFECGGYPQSEKAITLKLAEGFCREVKNGNKDLDMLTGIKAGPGCAKSTSTCEAYKACIEKAEAAAPPR